MGRKLMRLEQLVVPGTDKSWQQLQEEAVTEQVRAKRPAVRGKTVNHQSYLNAIDKSTIIFCIGPAGTGKTYMACGKAIEMLNAGMIQKIVLSRPLVPCGEDPGFLPGGLDEKIAPYMRPMLDALHDFIDPKDLRKLIETGIVELVPLAFMQGRTFHDAFVVLDEAQNASDEQIHMFLTRFGRNARVVVNGSIAQTNVRRVGENPLVAAINKFEARPSFKSKPMSVIRFSREDIVRHPFIQWIDETLTGDFDQKDVFDAGHDNDVVGSIQCPECGHSLCYEGDTDHVKCWQCSSVIEMYDENDEFDPAVCDHPIPYLTVQTSFQPAT